MKQYPRFKVCTIVRASCIRGLLNVSGTASKQFRHSLLILLHLLVNRKLKRDIGMCGAARVLTVHTTCVALAGWLALSVLASVR